MQENREMNIPREQTVLEYLEGTDGYVSNNELIRVIVTNTGYGNQPLSEFMNKHKLQYNREFPKPYQPHFIPMRSNIVGNTST